MVASNQTPIVDRYLRDQKTMTNQCPRCGYIELSPKEKEVARLIRNGHTMKEMVALMNVEVTTIKHHIGRVLRKMGVNSQIELVAVLLLPLDSPHRAEIERRNS